MWVELSISRPYSLVERLMIGGQTIVPNLREQAGMTVVAKAANGAKTGVTLGPWLVKRKFPDETAKS